MKLSFLLRLVIKESRSARAATISLTLLLSTFGSDIAAGSLFFAAPFLSFDTGVTPFSVAIGDLNKDGKPDLATANYGTNTVSVLLGNGDGTFGPKSNFGTGDRPNSVAIGDLNGDGKPDLVTANYSSRTVSVLLGNGDGTFRPKSDFGTEIGPVSVAIGDLDSDGNADLAVASFHSNAVSVLIGRGDGTFSPWGAYGTGSLPRFVAIGDLNGDGKPDLAVANSDYYGTVSVLLGSGDGTFGPKSDYVAGNYPFSLAIGDLNGDGKPDLAVANFGVNPSYVGTVSVLLGNGDGTFGPNIDYGAGIGPRSVAIGDLNGDRKPDLAVAANDGIYVSMLSVLRGNGDGTFAPRVEYGTGSGPLTVAIGDLNKDGKQDLAVAAGRGASYIGSVSVLLGNGDGTFGTSRKYGTGRQPQSVAIGDLNGDGKLDLAVVNYSSESVSVLLGNGDGTFRPRHDYGVGLGPSSVAIGDLNRDGKPDLAVTTTGFHSTVSVLLGTGDGTFGPKRDYPTGTLPESVVIGDLNGDGKPDLATANYISATVSVLLGNGDGTFGPRSDYGTRSGSMSLAIGDLNGDGKPDLAVANVDPNSVSVLLGSGDGTFGPMREYETGSYPWSLVIGDMNGDGKLDLAVSHISDITVSVLLGKGDGTFGPKSDYVTGSGYSSLGIADLNGDAKPDLAVANGGNNTVSVLPGIGDGTFGQKSDYGAGADPRSLAVGDLNGDGQPDLVLANYFSNTVTVLLNTFCPFAPMSFDLAPNTLNLRSMGHWVTATLEPDPPASPADIDIASILLNGSVAVDQSGSSSIGDADEDGRPDLTVKFDRATVELVVQEGDAVTVTVAGEIGNGCFEASDVIRVTRGHVSAPAAGSVLPGGGTTNVRWDTPADIRVLSVALLFSADDGVTWNLVAHQLPNTGSYLWTVPGTGTDQARIAVILVESADPTSYEVDGVMGVSARFAITSVLGVANENPGLALHGTLPNPGRGLNVSFGLATAEPAMLAAYDVSGRKVMVRQVGSLGAGRHTISLAAPGGLAPGIYLVHLVQGGRKFVARAAVVQ